jgi:hypothetical protein
MVEEQLTDRDIHVDKELRAYRVGLIEGLEALKTYNPEVDPETGEVIPE